MKNVYWKQSPVNISYMSLLSPFSPVYSSQFIKCVPSRCSYPVLFCPSRLNFSKNPNSFRLSKKKNRKSFCQLFVVSKKLRISLIFSFLNGVVSQCVPFVMTRIDLSVLSVKNIEHKKKLKVKLLKKMKERLSPFG